MEQGMIRYLWFWRRTVLVYFTLLHTPSSSELWAYSCNAVYMYIKAWIKPCIKLHILWESLQVSWWNIVNSTRSIFRKKLILLQTNFYANRKLRYSGNMEQPKYLLFCYYILQIRQSAIFIYIHLCTLNIMWAWSQPAWQFYVFFYTFIIACLYLKDISSFGFGMSYEWKSNSIC